MKKTYRRLTEREISVLESQMCSASDWSRIEVVEDFSPEYIRYTRFSGDIR